MFKIIIGVELIFDVDIFFFSKTYFVSKIDIKKRRKRIDNVIHFLSLNFYRRNLDVLRLNYYCGRASTPREILFEDRTKPHADNIGNGVDTTAAVGLLKGIHGQVSPDSTSSSECQARSYQEKRIVKDVVCFDARDYEKCIDLLKIDTFEPPVSQVNRVFS